MKNHILMAMILMWPGGAAMAADNVHLSGALVAEPCTLPDTDTDIQLNFGTVIEKYLYQYQRTKSQPFSIHLKDCDPAIMSSVSVTFQGAADKELTTLLALDMSSSAKGVAIGLELADGTPLAINKPSPFSQLTRGNNELSFNAFVQGLPSVIQNKTMVSGDFVATSNFVLTYQ
ncbi:fimbrial protein [Cronobacter dublinensis]|uniref:fimbrial protein n=1 Tax=Cronobacter dublinensis TaxID=413497 RepID=UPI0023DD1EDB|nr:fimbrial protein [Cronobacter dublinensis]MDT3666901.1 fimbrial protein [Cronobacter dublinensis]WEP44781.1 type 1 fimbrial protein [Cronobacter dublinensis]